MNLKPYELPLAPEPVKQLNLAERLKLDKLEIGQSYFVDCKKLNVLDGAVRTAVTRFCQKENKNMTCRKITVGVVEVDERYAAFVGTLQVFRHSDSLPQLANVPNASEVEMPNLTELVDDFTTPPIAKEPMPDWMLDDTPSDPTGWVNPFADSKSVPTLMERIEAHRAVHPEPLYSNCEICDAIGRDMAQEQLETGKLPWE